MSQNRLPRAEYAYVEEPKVRSYLLNFEHEQGKSKAKFFTNRGFAADDWNSLAQSLVTQGQNNPLSKSTDTPYGVRYQVDCNCPTPDQTNPCIRTVWEVAPSADNPRLVTAHPL